MILVERNWIEYIVNSLRFNYDLLKKKFENNSLNLDQIIFFQIEFNNYQYDDLKNNRKIKMF